MRYGPLLLALTVASVVGMAAYTYKRSPVSQFDVPPDSISPPTRDARPSVLPPASPIPALLAGESPPSEQLNPFKPGSSHGGMIAAYTTCLKAAPRGFLRPNAYCSCLSDAVFEKLRSSDSDSQTPALTRTQVLACEEFAISLSKDQLGPTPFAGVPVDNTASVMGYLRSCLNRETPKRTRGTSGRYCTCEIDAILSHGEQLFVSSDDRKLCETIASHSVNLTRRQLDLVKDSASPNAQALPTDSARITAAFRAHEAAVQTCFRASTSNIAGAPGVSVRFRIGPTGRVDSASIAPPSVGRTALGSCLVNVARGTRFPALGRELTFSIPITAQVVGH